MKYSQAIEQAMDRFGTDAVVRDSGDDQNILDHFKAIGDYGDHEVCVEELSVTREVDGELEFARALVLRWMSAGGYIDTGEAAATIFDGDDYERLYER